MGRVPRQPVCPRASPALPRQAVAGRRYAATAPKVYMREEIIAKILRLDPDAGIEPQECTSTQHRKDDKPPRDQEQQ